MRRSAENPGKGRRLRGITQHVTCLRSREPAAFITRLWTEPGRCKAREPSLRESESPMAGRSDPDCLDGVTDDETRSRRAEMCRHAGIYSRTPIPEATRPLRVRTNSLQES